MHRAKGQAAFGVIALSEAGWLKAIRVLNGDGYKEAAARLGKSMGTVQGLERSEVEGKISLRSINDFVGAYGLRARIQLEVVDAGKAELFEHLETHFEKIRRAQVEIRRSTRIIEALDDLLDARRNKSKLEAELEKIEAELEKLKL